MNQILVNKNKFRILGYKTSNKKINNKKIFAYKILLFISVVVIIISISYSIYGFKNRNENEKISKSIAETFSISTLYSEKNNKVIKTILEPKTKELKNTFSVIGIIKIDKIKISYPILSNTTDELLKISPCRFYGPMPNEVGNICIAAHNYNDNRFFSKINKLKKDDVICIYDNVGNVKLYNVYNIFETKTDDVSCTSQETGGKREITLVTCNNFNGNRIIVKAKEF